MTKKIVYNEGIPYQENDPSKPGIEVDGRRIGTDNQNSAPKRELQKRQVHKRDPRIDYLIDNLEKSFQS